MSLYIKITLVFVSLTAGWISPFYLSGFILKPTFCNFEYFYIYNDQNEKIVVHSYLMGEPDIKNWRYFAHIMPLNSSTNVPESHVGLMLKVNRDFKLTYHEMTTIKSSPMYLSKKNSITEINFLDPFARVGFAAPIYLFRGGNQWMVGFKNMPRYICSKS